MAHLIFLSLLVSLDGFFSGFTFRLKKIRICLPQLLFISLCPLVIVTAVMLSSQRLTAGIPARRSQGIRLCLVFLSGLSVVCGRVKKAQIQSAFTDYDDQQPSQFRSGSQPAAEQPRSVASGSGLKPGQRGAGLQLRAGWRAGGIDRLVFCDRQFPAGHGRQSLPGTAVYPPF